MSRWTNCSHLYCRPYLDCRICGCSHFEKRNEALLAALEERKEKVIQPSGQR